MPQVSNSITTDAPIASPRHTFISTQGFKFNKSKAFIWAGSPDKCEEKIYSLHNGLIALAIKADAVVFSPSITTGHLLIAAPKTTPAKAPISKPPTLARTSTPSVISGLLISNPFLTTAILISNLLSEIPVPLPVTISGGSLVNAPTIAADEVVFLLN